MKKLVTILYILFYTINATAQINDRDVERLMTRRMLPAKEVEYNAMVLLPRLFAENKTDTFNAVVAFWQKNCDISEPLFSISVLNAIKNNTFNEHLEWDECMHRMAKMMLRMDTTIYQSHIINYMQRYKENCHGEIPRSVNESWYNTGYPIYRDYAAYYTFLQQMAKSLLSRKDLPPAADFLVRFYASPDSTSYAAIDSPARKGTILSTQYAAYKKYNADVIGVSTGLYAGAWIPIGNLSVIGTQPYIGVNLGGRSEKITFETRVDLRFGSAANSYNVMSKDTLYSTTEFSGVYAGMELGRKLLRRGSSELDLTFGTGYELMSVLYKKVPATVAGEKDRVISRSLSTWNINAGLSYKIYVRNTYQKGKRRFNYFALQTSYNFINYNNTGGTNMSGNSITVGIAYGGYSHNFTRFSHLD